ncbi:hypothetical protein Pint_22109 [Pistacia integerrima]|uniref:Uncharacterized protein n=1 Tax=Pistacia integerrima TaxID=434235 RepID=A0ACC0YLQ4_9ROSI|nr:hypothetical protein Pint_22109 [Pistacia integerrima]
MSNLKRVVIIMLCVLLTWSFLVRDTEGTDLGYVPINKGDTVPCGPKSPQGCKETPANRYQRGCNPATKCRGDAPPVPNPEHNERLSAPPKKD